MARNIQDNRYREKLFSFRIPAVSMMVFTFGISHLSHYLDETPICRTKKEQQFQGLVKYPQTWTGK